MDRTYAEDDEASGPSPITLEGIGSDAVCGRPPRTRVVEDVAAEGADPVCRMSIKAPMMWRPDGTR